MTDTMTQKPLQVSTGGRPYLMLPYIQVPEVERLLTGRVIYRVEENVVSLNGGPEVAIIDFGRDADTVAIQAILDSAN